MHAIFWFITQPVNKIWTKDVKLDKAGCAFFSRRQREGQQRAD